MRKPAQKISAQKQVAELERPSGHRGSGQRPVGPVVRRELSDRPHTGTLGKALEVLEVIASATTPLRFTAVLDQVDQPRGTLHRNLANLLAEDLVQVTADGGYEPGVRLLKMAARSWASSSLRSVAAPHMKALHALTGETVHLGQISGLEVIYLDKIESTRSVRMHSQIGNASPLYCTGIGKAMLSVLPADEVRRKASAFDYHAYTSATLVSADDLLSEIEVIKAEGCAYDREEHEAGIACVAAPISAPGLTAGISVTAPVFRASPSVLRDWAPAVRSAAKNIEEELSIRLEPRHGE